MTLSEATTQVLQSPKREQQGLKTAIIHDWLNQRGGAELVLDVLHQMFPQAPIFTSMYAPRVMPREYRQWDIRTSFMQRLPLAKKHHQPFLPFYPYAFETFDLSEYDLVLSNSSGFCHGVLTPPTACHVNYCLTPPRFIWALPQYLRRERVGGLSKRILPFVVSYLRNWDSTAADRVDYFVGISKAVVARIRKYYRRDAALIYPPVDTSRFSVAPLQEVGDYFLVVSRLVPYKRVDLAVEAFNRLGLPLVVVGDGRDLAALKSAAKANVTFTGRVSGEEVQRLFSRCRAFIFPGEEDFGIAPLEAQASGRPVIAYAAGGALETVVDGVTGLFFREQSPESLAEAVLRYRNKDFDPGAIRKNAERFDTEVFTSQLRRFLAAKLVEHRQLVGLD